MRTEPGPLMPPASETKLSQQQSRSIAATIREELARRRISRQHLADQAKISISTLEKALAGRRPFTLATTIRLEEALGVALWTRDGDGAAPPRLGLAPGELGFYARPAVSWIEGAYLTLRPSFGGGTAVFAYRTDILWDDGSSSLIFRESERTDAAFTQHGSVSVPHQSGHIYLVTSIQGQYRLIIVTRPIRGQMHGILATLLAGRGAQLTPVACPIALLRMAELPDVQFGRIPAEHPCYQPYHQHLKRTVEEPFALFLPGE